MMINCLYSSVANKDVHPKILVIQGKFIVINLRLMLHNKT